MLERQDTIIISYHSFPLAPSCRRLYYYACSTPACNASDAPTHAYTVSRPTRAQRRRSLQHVLRRTTYSIKTASRNQRLAAEVLSRASDLLASLIGRVAWWPPYSWHCSRHTTFAALMNHSICCYFQRPFDL